MLENYFISIKSVVNLRCGWKRRSEGLVMAVTEGEIGGKCLPGRRRTAWIDNVGRWTEGGLPAARRIALDRL